MLRAHNSRYTLTQRQKIRPGRRSAPTVLRNCESGESHRFGSEQSEILIGASDKCDIIICDDFASATHCVLRRLRGDTWQLSDHGSKNGTRINGTRVAVGELRPGCQIAIGDTSFELASAAETQGKARDRLIGKSPQLLSAIDQALKAARTNCSVLILGETGTGKELFAQLIHEASRRAPQSFVAVNCGSLPDQLVRSELFGHVKGAFTGATEDHAGLFRMAHQGTIFLDEVGELPIAQQPHLLRALETGLIRPVGGRLEELVNTRVVAATNRHCLDSMRTTLREDLYHRLSAIVIELPPLRERKRDIPVLVQHFLAMGQDEFGVRHVRPKTLRRLSEHEWLGNIRELRNSVVRAMALGRGQLTLRDFLPNGIQRPAPASTAQESEHARVEMLGLTAYQKSQRTIIADAYRRLGSIRAAAAELGLPKSTLADLCRRLGIDTSRRRR